MSQYQHRLPRLTSSCSTLGWWREPQALAELIQYVKRVSACEDALDCSDEQLASLRCIDWSLFQFVLKNLFWTRDEEDEALGTVDATGVTASTKTPPERILTDNLAKKLWCAWKGYMALPSRETAEYATCIELGLAGIVMTAVRRVFKNDIPVDAAFKELSETLHVFITRHIPDSASSSLLSDVWTRIVRGIVFEDRHDALDTELTWTDLAACVQVLFDNRVEPRMTSIVCSCKVLTDAFTESSKHKLSTLSHPFRAYLQDLGLPNDEFATAVDPSLFLNASSNIMDTLQCFAEVLSQPSRKLGSAASSDASGSCHLWCAHAVEHMSVRLHESSLGQPDVVKMNGAVAHKVHTVVKDPKALGSSTTASEKLADPPTSMENPQTISVFPVFPMSPSNIDIAPKVASAEQTASSDFGAQNSRGSEQSTVPALGQSIRPLLPPIEASATPRRNLPSADKTDQGKLLDDLTHLVSPRQLPPISTTGKSASKANPHPHQPAASEPAAPIEPPSARASLPPLRKMETKRTLSKDREVSIPTTQCPEETKAPTTAEVPITDESVPVEPSQYSSGAASFGYSLADLLKMLPDDSHARSRDSDELSVEPENDGFDDRGLDADPDAILQDEKAREQLQLPPSPVLGGKIVDADKSNIPGEAGVSTERPLDLALLSSVPEAPELAWKQRTKEQRSSDVSNCEEDAEGDLDFKESALAARVLAERTGIVQTKELNMQQPPLPTANTDRDDDLDPEQFVAAELLNPVHVQEIERIVESLPALASDPVKPDQDQDNRGHEKIAPDTSASQPDPVYQNAQPLVIDTRGNDKLQAELELLGLTELNYDPEEYDANDADLPSLGSSFDSPDAPSSMVLSDSDSDMDDDPPAPSPQVGMRKLSLPGSSSAVATSTDANSQRPRSPTADERVERHTLHRMRRNSQTGMINGVQLGFEPFVAGSDAVHSPAAVEQPDRVDKSAPGVSKLPRVDQNQPAASAPFPKRSLEDSPDEPRSAPLPKPPHVAFNLDAERAGSTAQSETPPSPLPKVVLGTSLLTKVMASGEESDSNYSWDPTRRLEWEDSEDEGSGEESDVSDPELENLPGRISTTSKRSQPKTLPPTREDEYDPDDLTHASLRLHGNDRAENGSKKPGHKRSNTGSGKGAADEDDGCSDVVAEALAIAAAGNFPRTHTKSTRSNYKYRHPDKAEVTELSEYQPGPLAALPSKAEGGRVSSISSRGPRPSLQMVGTPGKSKVGTAPTLDIPDEDEQDSDDPSKYSPMTRVRMISTRLAEHMDGSEFDVSDIAAWPQGSSIVQSSDLGAPTGTPPGAGTWVEPNSSRSKPDAKNNNESPQICGCQSCTIA